MDNDSKARVAIIFAATLVVTFVAAPAAAQDRPWGPGAQGKQQPAKKPAAKKPPQKAPAKAPAAKAPAAKAPAKAPAAKAPAKAPPAKAPPKDTPGGTSTKTERGVWQRQAPNAPAKKLAPDAPKPAAPTTATPAAGDAAQKPPAAAAEAPQKTHTAEDNAGAKDGAATPKGDGMANPEPAPAAKAPADTSGATVAIAPDPTAKPSEEAHETSASLGVSDTLRRELSPYGTWTRTKDHGVVWVPAVTSDFAPYLSHGHWLVSSAGQWTWKSLYPWGRIPFHYGRWIWTKPHRWVWVPQNGYAPAWVVWRTSKRGYVGWAPMGPDSSGSKAKLAFWFLPARNVFAQDLPKHIIRDPNLGSRVLAHSTVVGAHYTGRKGFAAASPSFEAIGLAQPAPAPVIHIHRSRPASSRFATPPPEHGKLRYRCRALDTSPRAWRCGLERVGQ